ncbi:unnamed protein product [Boreogadus saida]
MMEFDLVRRLSSATSSACLRAVGDERVKRAESTWLLPPVSRWSTFTDGFFVKWYQERQPLRSGDLVGTVSHRSTAVNALRDREDEADGEVLSEPAVP